MWCMGPPLLACVFLSFSWTHIGPSLCAPSATTKCQRLKAIDANIAICGILLHYPSFYLIFSQELLYVNQDSVRLRTGPFVGN